MTDFLTSNELYVVLIIVLVVWLGIYGYLVRLDNRLKKIERETENKPQGRNR